MAGNSGRRGAHRNPGSKKGATIGSGGQRRRGLAAKGPTPKAEDRTGHPAQRQAARAAQTRGKVADASELLVGRNSVLEALRVSIPATALYVAIGINSDERVVEAMRVASDRSLPLLDVSRPELDRMTGGTLHQGLALRVPPYSYHHPDELLETAQISDDATLLVALDGVVDPRNVGAVVRSAAAFGAHGLVLPERRAAGLTAAAWRTSAGAAGRIPVARAKNLNRTLTAYQKAGLMVVGLDAAGPTRLDDFEAATSPMVLVVGSEGSGLSRLVGETCDLRLSIPMTRATESLNASVAASIALAEVARQRRRVS